MGVVNNVDLTEAGEFSIDLFTMSDNLTKALWDHLVSRRSRGARGSLERRRFADGVALQVKKGLVS